MKNATCEPFKLVEVENRAAIGVRRWGKNGEQPQNATVPPFGDEYAVQCHRYARRKPSARAGVVRQGADKRRLLGRKSGAEPGWLPDDELTRQWLKYVEEYRSECDAADQAESPSDKGAEEDVS